MYSVSELARISGLTVRTLHHYDEIGLLTAAERSPSGYRRYGADELERLQQILFFRERDFGLGEIHRLLDDPQIDRRRMLEMQRELLVARMVRIERIVAAIDATMKGEGPTMTPDDMREVFGDFDPAIYEEEVEQRWGGTDAYAESKRRTSSYRKEDWQRIMAEGNEISRTLGALCAAGADPGGDEARDAAERHRRHISDNFYECSPNMHAALGEMYEADARFTATWEEIQPGLTAFVKQAFAANAERQG